MNPSQRPAYFQDFRSSTLWLAVAVLLIVCGLGWRWVDFSGSDAGPLNERGRETRAYSAMMDQAPAKNFAWFRDPALAADIWKEGWLALNGQWDTRVVAAASTLLHAGAWALLLGFVAVRLREVWHYGLVLAVAMAVLLMPRAGEFWTSAATAWSGWLVLLSILQLGTQRLECVGRGLWWLGWGAGLLNVIGAKEGGAAALVLAIAAVPALVRQEGRSRKAWWQLVASGGLVVLSAMLWIQRGNVAAASAGSGGWAGVSDYFRWPHGSNLAAALLFLPAALWLFEAVRRPEMPGKRGVLSVVAGWSLLQPVVIAWAGEQAGAAGWGAMGPGILINGFCLTALAARWAGRPAVRATVFTLWALGATQALFQVGLERDDTAVFHETEKWRLAWIGNDAAALARASAWAPGEAEALLALKADAEVQRILPPSLRAPLALDAMEGSATRFRRDELRFLKGEAVGMPAWVAGTDRHAESGGAGEFVSEPLMTTHAMLRLWIAGERVGKMVEVMLRTESGREILPLQTPSTSAERWVRVNFDAPGEAFRLVVRPADPKGWVAFAGAVESGRLSWLFPKIVAIWPWLAGAGVLAGVVGLVVAAWVPIRRARERIRGADEGAGVTKMAPWLALGVYVTVIAQGMAPAAGGSDSSGYLNAARMFSEGRVTMTPREVAGVTAEEFGQAVFMPLAFKETVRPGELATITAIGLPLMYAAVALFIPLSFAVPVTILANMVLGIVFTRLIAEAFGLSRRWAWLAAGIAGLSPLYLYMGLQAMSDGASLTWVTIAVYFAWSSRTRPGHAWLAGVATAIAVLIRPSNFLCVVPILLCLAGSWRTLVCWGLGGVPGALIQMWHSWQVWGHPLKSGYDNVAEALGLEFVPLSLASYAMWLPLVLTPVVVLGLGMPFMRSVPMRVRLVLVAWVVVFGGFYAIFRHTHEAWWFLRFILPAFPALIVAGLLMLRRIAEQWRWPAFSVRQRRGLAQLGVILLLGFLLLGVRQFQVFFWLRGDRVFERAMTWLKENAPADSIVVAAHGGGSVVYYSDLPVILFYQEVVRESPRFAQALAAAGKPVYALVFHFECPGGRPDFLGTWEEVASFQDGQVRIWKWTGGAAVPRTVSDRGESSLPSTPRG